MEDFIENTSNKSAICVPIVALVQFGIIAEAKRIATMDVDMAEWRIDFFAGEAREITGMVAELKAILGEKKLIATLRTSNEGGQESGDRFDYFSVIQRIIEQDIADYVDIEVMRDEDKAKRLIELAGDKKITVIGSYHDFETMPEEDFIYDMLKKCKDSGYGMGKVACMAKSGEEATRMLDVTGRFADEFPDYPITTVAMGKPGYITRLYGGLYGSRITFAALEKRSAPGQRNVDEMHRVFDLIYSKPKHIFLIGFMGVGKTTVARKLSEMYGLTEIDTDRLIEENTGRMISDIFEVDGEQTFRKIETDTLDELGEYKNAVVSCGGGVVLKDLNVRKLKQMGKIVLLTATAQTVYERVKDSDTRPLLQGNMNVEYIQSLMDKRLSHYEAAADIVISTDGRDASGIAREVYGAIMDKSDK